MRRIIAIFFAVSAISAAGVTTTITDHCSATGPTPGSPQVTGTSSCTSTYGLAISAQGYGMVTGFDTTTLYASVSSGVIITAYSADAVARDDGVQASDTTTLDIEAFTAGPVRPGWLLLVGASYAQTEVDGVRFSSTASNSLDIDSGLYTFGCSGSCDASPSVLPIPVSLGTELDITLTGSGTGCAGLGCLGSGIPEEASGGGNLQIYLEAVDPSGCGAGCSAPVIISETQPAPEPASLPLALLGCATINLIRRRR